LQDNGVTIEGIAVIGNRLFAGFRGPALENGRAPVLAVALNALFGDKAPRARLFLLPVGEGQGIRDLAPFRGGMLVLAGPAGDKAERYDVFWWDGASEDVRHLAEITEAAGATARHKPEAILPLDRAGKKLRVLILSDGEEEGAPRAIRIRAP
jgi:hypothetical protein